MLVKHACLTVLAWKRKIILDIIVLPSIYRSIAPISPFTHLIVRSRTRFPELVKDLHMKASSPKFHRTSPRTSSSMSRVAPSIPTSLCLNPLAKSPTTKELHLCTKYFSRDPILRFTVGKCSQLHPAESPEVALVGRSNVGVSLSDPRPRPFVLSLISQLLCFVHLLFSS
jgi:hypothetical protein